MADRVLFLSWRQPSRGREARAIEVFNEAVGILGRKQQEGKIEGFQIAFLEPNEALGGYMHVTGTAEQLVALREDEEFQRNTVAAQLSVDGMSHLQGFTNEGIAAQMALYEDEVAKAPQA
jgi:hypothetical protein